MDCDGLFGMSDGYAAYQTFLALKFHFTSDTYDYFKYNKKVKASRDSFEKRNDKYFFQKLERSGDVENRILAAFAYDDNNKLFIGSLIKEQKYQDLYKKLLSNKLSLSYIVDQEIRALLPDKIDVYSGSIPEAITEFQAGRVSLETLCVLGEVSNILEMWEDEVSDTLFFPEILMKIRKYTPFIKANIDKPKFKSLVKELLS
jgi:hypothetical protein